MTCQEFETQIASYMDGSLSESQSLAVEEHASTCAVCDARLEGLSVRSTAGFAPALPAELRAQTLAAVATRRARAHAGTAAKVQGPRVRPMRWVGAVAAFAAVAVLMVIARPREKQAQRIYADSSRAGVALPDTTSSAGLADERARPEFTALDDAARELRAALAASPDDPQLRDFLATVNARRAELERRVKDARS